MLESLDKFQDRRRPEKRGRPLDLDGSYCHPVSDMREPAQGPW